MNFFKNVSFYFSNISESRRFNKFLKMNAESEIVKVTGTKSRELKCRRCKAHGFQVKLQHHKHFCCFRHCLCKLCYSFNHRRKLDYFFVFLRQDPLEVESRLRVFDQMNIGLDIIKRQYIQSKLESFDNVIGKERIQDPAISSTSSQNNEIGE